MLLQDKIDFYGVFSFKCIDAGGNVLDEYTEKNLIMDKARSNMAQLVGGVTTGGGTAQGYAINRFAIGTMGHMGTNILDYQQVGETDTTKPSGNQIFASTRTALFSESNSGTNYRINFVASGDSDVYGGASAGSDSSSTTVTGARYTGTTKVGTDEGGNSVRRVVSDRTVTYTVVIPAANANSGDINNPVVAYTEAALYAGDEIFSMKTFPARVKENTVKFEITWSIIF